MSNPFNPCTAAPQPAHSMRRHALLPQLEWRLTHDSHAHYHPHTHDEFSVGVIDAGAATCTVPGHTRTLRAGMTVALNPGEPHACNPADRQRWSYRMLFIDTAWVAALQHACGVRTAGLDWAPFAPTVPNPAAAYQAFNHLFDQLLHEADPAALETALVDYLLSHGFAPHTARPPANAPLAQLNQAKALILDRLDTPVSLADLEHACDLNRFHLIRSFKQVFGQTPHAFQLDQRINRAKRLLRQGHALADVAHALGFADQSHFQRHFKKRHALTPRAYQTGG